MMEPLKLRCWAARELSIIAIVFLMLASCKTSAKEVSAPAIAGKEPASVGEPTGPLAPSQDEDAPPRFESAKGRDHEESAAGVKLTLLPKEAPDGGVIFLRIQLDPARNPGLTAEKISIAFEDQRPAVFPMGENTFGSIIPIIFNTKPRQTKIEVSLPQHKVALNYEVIDGKYSSEVLSVAPKFTNPSKKDLARIKRENQELAGIYRSVTKERYWKGSFGLPVESKLTSSFGNKRVFNGEMKSFHQGVDLRARTPVPIYAPEDGVIALSKDLFFSGKTVIIDHGYGLYTLYAHMSRLDLKPGQNVKRGDRLGLSGATGRIQAPHLHWGAVIQGAKVNPLDLIRVLPASDLAASTP